MGYHGIAPTPPRTYELWAEMKTWLDTVRMAAILGGAGRIRLAHEELAPFDAETAAWGRVVIVPVTRAFGEPVEGAGRNRMVPFLVRAEVHAPGGDAAYDPLIAAEAAHEEAFQQLHGWAPGSFTYARVVGAVSRETVPQAFPLWDDTLGLWFLSAEYRATLAPA